jgi:hypothetical protein
MHNVQAGIRKAAQSVYQGWTMLLQVSINNTPMATAAPPPGKM